MCVFVFCLLMYSYIPVSRTSLRTRSNVAYSHQMQPLSAPSSFPSIYLNSLTFSLSKMLTLIISFFKSGDIAFLFGILIAGNTRCH